MNYDIVFVDWNGTLSDSCFWERWRDDPEQAEKYAKIQHALFESATGRSLMKSWMTGFKDSDAALTYLTESTRVPRDELEDELRYSAENMKLIDEDVLPTIQKLRDIGKLVVIATDNMDTFDKWTVPALGLNEHFDDVLNSSKVRVLKSQVSSMYNRSQFFFQYMREMGVAPENTVLIDDSLDVKGLESVGINFKHVTDGQPLSYHLDTILAK